MEMVSWFSWDTHHRRKGFLVENIKVGGWAGHEGIGQWLQGPECQNMVQKFADRVAAIYEATVAKRTGKLAESITVDTHLVNHGNGPRWNAVVRATTPYAGFHEFGTSHTSAAQALNKALTSAGAR